MSGSLILAKKGNKVNKTLMLWEEKTYYTLNTSYFSYFSLFTEYYKYNFI